MSTQQMYYSGDVYYVHVTEVLYSGVHTAIVHYAHRTIV